MNMNGMMRETVSFDIGLDSYVIHHDVYDGKQQLSFDQSFKEISDLNDDIVSGFRKRAEEALSEYMKECGISPADLKKMPDQPNSIKL